MIAFDFDGVFIPDFDKIPMLGGIEEFYEMTQFIQPIFIPKGRWSILTGRIHHYLKYTKSYSDKYFSDNKPTTIYHDRGLHEKPHEYKARILQEYDAQILMYVESDPFTVEYIQSKVPNCSVYLFKEFISSELASTFQNSL